MEYERAIYRVYERCLEGLREETEPNSIKYCRILELFLILLGSLMLIGLIALHLTFVGPNASLHCLSTLLLEKNITSLPRDMVLYIDIDQKYAPEVMNYLRNNKNSNNEKGDDYTNSMSSNENMIVGDIGNYYLQAMWNMIPQRPSVRVLTQIKSIRRFNNHDDDRIGSSSVDSMTGNIVGNDKRKRGYYYDRLITQSLSSFASSIVSAFSIAGINNTNTTLLPPSSSPSSLYNESKFDYEFSYEPSLLAMPYSMRIQHQFPSVNVTMTGSKCFGNAFIQSFLPFSGIDSIVLNNIVQYVKQPGSLLTILDDYYAWNLHSIYPYGNFATWFVFKINIAIQSCLCFFLLSTTTALLIRILISSGVVLLFPIFSLMQMLGFNAISSHIIRLSYPWIGIPMEYLRIRNRPVFPFIMSHACRVVLSYIYYESCQIAFSLWLYDEISPGQVQLWLFASMMLWEYYTMIYVRSMSSIVLFPRASFALFLLYHFYIFSHPFGFHLLALLVMQLFLTALMIHCVRKYEVDAFYRGLVSLDHPRMAYNTTPWPTWMGALAPDLTIFMPLSDRTLDVYQQQVPVPGGAAAVQNLQAMGPAPSVATTSAAVPSSGIVDPTSSANQSTAASSSAGLSSQYQSLGQTVPTQQRELELSSRTPLAGNEQASSISRLLRGESSRIRIGSTSGSSLLPSGGGVSGATYSLLHTDTTSQTSRRSSRRNSGGEDEENEDGRG